MTQPTDSDQAETADLYPVDSRSRSCCGGIGGHTQSCAPRAAVHLDLQLLLDRAANMAELARIDGSAALQALPEGGPLFASVDLVAALGHLRLALRLIDRAAVAIERTADASLTGGEG